jgi:hypothetical protein
METIHRFATNKNNEKLFIFLWMFLFTNDTCSHLIAEDLCSCFELVGMIYLVGRDCVLQSFSSANKLWQLWSSNGGWLWFFSRV